jgi:hypothetical protein
MQQLMVADANNRTSASCTIFVWWAKAILTRQAILAPKLLDSSDLQKGFKIKIFEEQRQRPNSEFSNFEDY